MNLTDYQKLCKATAKQFDSNETAIITWGLGITGEAGDVASCIKKTFMHDNDQRAGIRENLGDTMWYIAMICNSFGWNMDEIMEENVKKLKTRYPNGFDANNARRNNTKIDWNEK